MEIAGQAVSEILFHHENSLYKNAKNIHQPWREEMKMKQAITRDVDE